MPHPTFQRLITGVTATFMLSVAPVAFAQAPAQLPKVITFVVPQATGGSNDAMGRAVASRLPKVIDANVVVDNRPGGTGNVGTAWVAHTAPKDGSVWLVTVNSAMTINPALFSKTGFHPIDDFVPVGGIAVVPHVLLTRTDSPAKSLADVLKLAREEPNKYSYGSAGNGTFSHLLMEHMKQNQKVSITHIPYKGVAPAVTDLIGGQLQYVISTVPASTPFIKSGQLRPLAVPSRQRVATLPDVPVASETVPGMVADLWVALYAPKETPSALVQQMHQALEQVKKMPDMQAFLQAQGASGFNVDPDQLLTMTKAELEQWGALVRSTGLRVD